MTTSPVDTSSGIRFSPSSSQRPGPTATTVPSCGFSLAVSGMTRPDAVVVSASLACTRILSSSGLMFTLATMEPPPCSGCVSGAVPRTCRNYQVFGMRPCPRAVVAGADTGTVRLPPSTLYMRVLALKVTPLLRVELPWVDLQVRGHVADHLDVDLTGGEVPAAILAVEAVEIPAHHDRLQGQGVGGLYDAERRAGGGRRPVVTDLHDGIEHQVPSTWCAGLRVATGGHREQL